MKQALGDGGFFEEIPALRLVAAGWTNRFATATSTVAAGRDAGRRASGNGGGDGVAMQLRELAKALDADLVGDGGKHVARPVHPAEADAPGDLALAMEPALVKLLRDSPARLAVVSEGAEVPEGALDGYLVVRRSRHAMAGLMDVFARPPRRAPGVDPLARVAEDAVLGDGVSLGPFVTVGSGAVIGAGTVVLDSVSIGADARVGENCLFYPGARIGERVEIGARVILQPNACIGSDGFSYVTPKPGSVETAKATGRVEARNTEIVRINSIGTVVLEDDVEIGACSTIDRATVAATRIGRNTKIDNLVMVGHNCRIGENCFICAQVGVAGSTVIGDRVVLAGQVGVADHITIGSDAVAAAGSGVGNNVPPRTVVAGFPALERGKAFEQHMYVRRLKSMFKGLEALKARVKALEAGRAAQGGAPDEV